ncbi:MAG: two pore domain potassium channel family protein, partial [Calditrichaeota bacterium]
MSDSETNSIKNFTVVALALVLLMVIGVVGYSVLQHFDFLDALYMTFITFSTVGFRELGPLNIHGRIFTMFLILFGLIILSMLSASVTSL